MRKVAGRHRQHALHSGRSGRTTAHLPKPTRSIRTKRLATHCAGGATFLASGNHLATPTQMKKRLTAQSL